MKEYGLIVIGSGAGMNVVDSALARGAEAAVVEEGPLGGTCLNRGCIPSKVLIHAADAIREAEAAAAVGVDLRFAGVDYSKLKKRMWDIVLKGRREMEEGVERARGLDLYESVGKFVADHTLEVGGKRIHSPRIVIASGARPHIPDIPGLDGVEHLTYKTVFGLEERPEGIIILGGGYIGCEFAHFFSAIGTRTTLVGRNAALLPKEEPETSALVQRRLSRHVDVHTGTDVLGVERSSEGVFVRMAKRGGDGERTVGAQHLLVATGVRPNSDWLRPENTGVRTDGRGWVLTDEHLETTRPGIFALGDALGRNMFRHTANYQARIVEHNLWGKHKVAMDLHAVPHAVFTDPQVGQVGMTEEEARRQAEVMVGIARYDETAMGYAYGDEEAFVKVVVEHPTRRILGATAVGPQSATLIQQVVNMMSSGDGSYTPLARAQVIHPTLSETLSSAFSRMRPANFTPDEHGRQHGHR
ncbi:MAG: dihydrolipoyl dehydrogenase [Methanobacteriota archaeon]|nr:MAG: dihydrolipoyl dehydrogenase [Euryarchaeota archaeon]